MATNYSIQTHTKRPQDVFEPPFAALHYFVCEHIAGEQKHFSSVVVNTDETREFSDIEALKAAFYKRARNFALSNQCVAAKDSAEIDADSASVNVMSAMMAQALFEFAQAASGTNKKLETAFEQAFSQKVAFKCAVKIVRELTILEIASAQKHAISKTTAKIVGEQKELGQQEEAENETEKGTQESEEAAELTTDSSMNEDTQEDEQESDSTNEAEAESSEAEAEAETSTKEGDKDAL